MIRAKLPIQLVVPLAAIKIIVAMHTWRQVAKPVSFGVAITVNHIIAYPAENMVITAQAEELIVPSIRFLLQLIHFITVNPIVFMAAVDGI